MAIKVSPHAMLAFVLTESRNEPLPRRLASAITTVFRGRLKKKKTAQVLKEQGSILKLWSSHAFLIN